MLRFNILADLILHCFVDELNDRRAEVDKER